MFSGILGALGSVAGVFQVIPTVVRLVERLFGNKSGPDKQSAAVELLTSLLPLFGVKDTNSTTELVEGIALLIPGVVKVMHALGEFTHKES